MSCKINAKYNIFGNIIYCAITFIFLFAGSRLHLGQGLNASYNPVGQKGMNHRCIFEIFGGKKKIWFGGVISLCSHTATFGNLNHE